MPESLIVPKIFCLYWDSLIFKILEVQQWYIVYHTFGKFVSSVRCFTYLYSIFITWFKLFKKKLCSLIYIELSLWIISLDNLIHLFHLCKYLLNFKHILQINTKNMNHLHEVTTTNSKHHKVKDYYLLLLLKFLTGIARSAILLELQEDDY